MTSAAGKKITIKNVLKIPAVPENYPDLQWAKLEKAIKAIYHLQPLETSLQELYRTVENMCTLKYGSTMYDNLFSLIEMQVKCELMPLLPLENGFLEAINAAWVTFHKHTTLIRNIFLYLDRSFILANQYLMSINHMSTSLFKEHIVMNPIIRTKVVEGILVLIMQERQGIEVDRGLLKSLTSMLFTLQVYDVIFEPAFLQASETMYQMEGELLIVEYNISQYLKQVAARKQEEELRIKHYLNVYTEQKLMDVVIRQLLKTHLKQILEKSETLVDSNSLEDLTLLYKLLGCLNSSRSELCQAFGEYLKKRGSLIVMNPENDKNMIYDLLLYKDKIDNIVEKCFENNEKFLNTVRDSFKCFINQRHNKPAELLAKYVDSKLRCKEEEDIEKLLKKIMVLFRFVQGKDVFEAFYKRDLAKRLLVGKSASQDAENSMISKLKQECGEGFTSKLEGMFKDVNVSQGVNTAFKQYLNHIQTIGDGNVAMSIDMCVNVLTSSYWPSYPLYEINLPSEMVLYQNIFLKFYMGNHSGRRLQWQPNLGHCILKAEFKKGRKELQVSLFQTIVLLLFNSAPDLVYKEIQDAVNLEENELKRTLQSLACGKTRVLFKFPKGKDVESDDNFTFNKDFTDKLFRVKINQVQMKETVEEHRATEESVIHDRQFQIDAAIVRIMKQKKTLSHNLLMTELYNALDIPVKPADLKKRIEQLIERDYIERDKENSTIYKYIA